MNRPINNVRSVESTTYVVHEAVVQKLTSKSDMKVVSKKYGEKATILDTNGQFLLLNKKGKYCVEKMMEESKKDAANCFKVELREYLYPSEAGFWFLDPQLQRVSLLTFDGKIDFDISRINQATVLHSRGISNYLVLASGEGTTVLTLKERGIILAHQADKSLCSITAAHEAAGVSQNPKQLHLNCAVAEKSGHALSVVELFDGAVKNSKPVTSVHLKGAPKRIWLVREEGKLYPAIAYVGGLFVYYAPDGNQKWEISSELGSTLDVLVAEFDSTEESEEIPQYEAFGKNFVGAFLFRVTADLKSLTGFAQSLLQILASLDMQKVLDRVMGKHEFLLEDENYYNKYGLRKNLIFVTASNKLVSIDSLNGQVRWTTLLKPSQATVRALVNHNNNIDLIYTEDGVKKRTEISSVDGKFISSDLKVDQRATVFLEAPESQAPIEIGFSNNFLKNTKSEFAFYKVHRQAGVTGYRRKATGEFAEVWDYRLEPGQEILDYSYHLKGDNQYIEKSAKGSMVTLPEEDALFFRVVDSGNIALLAKQRVNENWVLVIVIINTVRGKVLGTYFTDHVDLAQPIGFVYDANGIYVSYFNDKLKGFELWAIEIFRTKVETSFIEMYPYVTQAAEIRLQNEERRRVRLQQRGQPVHHTQQEVRPVSRTQAPERRHHKTRTDQEKPHRSDHQGRCRLASLSSSRSIESWFRPEERQKKCSRSRKEN